MKNQASRFLRSELNALANICFKPKTVVLLLIWQIGLILFFDHCYVYAVELRIYTGGRILPKAAVTYRPDQLPQSRVAIGKHNIEAAWLAGSTVRYRHGVLGDKAEASRLELAMADGRRLTFKLPLRRVFEDLEPRLVDLNGDQNDEIIVVESDAERGASLAVFGIVSGQLERIAATPFLEQRYRWLNPLGTGDFDGDGRLDIALVATPHIGGRLRLYRVSGKELSLFAEYKYVSTHSIGSTELGLGRIVHSSPRDLFLVPDQAKRTMLLLEWNREKWKVLAKTTLPGTLGSSLVQVSPNRWQFSLENGVFYNLLLIM